MDLQLRNDQSVETHLTPTPSDEFLGVAEDRPLGDSIFDAISDAILVIDRSGTIDRVNAATIELTGFAAEELVGQPIATLTRNNRIFDRIFKHTLSDRGHRYELRCKRRDGSDFPVSVSTSAIFDPAIGDHKLVCVARDVTRRKRLEAESRAISRIIHGVTATANLEDLFELIHRTIKKILYAENFFVALIDPVTEILSVQFWVDKYDPMPPPFKLGRSLSAHVFRKGEPMLLTDSEVQKIVATGEVENVGTDSPIWLGVPLKTPAGTIGVLVVQDYERCDTYTERDLDLLASVADQIAIAIERKRGEDALKLSQERFQLVTQATSDAVWDWNLFSDEIWWNDGIYKLFGYTPEEMGGEIMGWQERIHPEDRERVVRDIHQHIDAGKAHWTAEYRFTRKDGSYAFVIDRGYVVYDQDEMPVRMIGSIMDVTERKSLEEQLTHQALHDPLTNIANRALFQNRVDHALAKLPRSNSQLAVLFLDLDNFKAVNDSLGHAAGDKLLIAVAERLQDCLRTTDTPARLGGDEFSVLCESVHRVDEAVMIAERILAVFRQPFMIDGKETFVGTSIGIAASSDASMTSEELLRNADLAMYLAKSQGKGTYVVFEPKMHEALMERIELEDDLRRGIDQHEFVIHYQPILDLSSHNMLGMEALVRWVHPKYGLLSPMKFIPLAEETNLIVPLGEWVLSEACRQVQEWRGRHAGDMDFSVTVNISIRQFQQKELVEMVSRALEVSGLPARCLILEITESFMMQDTEATIVKLQLLRDLGVRLAIDDFGTGYSSLSYLQRFPIDILKIDKSFIDKLGQGSEGSAVAKAIIMMGDSLNLKTIAEGIEHPEQIAELQSLGCAAGQGYHFARPLTAVDMDKFLTDRELS